MPLLSTGMPSNKDSHHVAKLGRNLMSPHLCLVRDIHPDDSVHSSQLPHRVDGWPLHALTKYVIY